MTPKKDPLEDNMHEDEEELKTYDISDTDESEKMDDKDPDKLTKEISELNNKYLRLYADFENYKRLSVKDKEELIKYSLEEFMKEIITVVDHLELALQHSSNGEASKALADGVGLTLKELISILEKFGLVRIEALGKPFDPFVHHAMSQIENDEKDENIVVEEFRKGYMLKDRVLRASLVGVSKKTSKQTTDSEEE